MTTTQRTVPSSPAFVPVGPFRRLVNEWLDVQMAAWSSAPEGKTCPTTLLCEIVWPQHGPETSKRRLYAFRNEQREMHFDTADRIVCKLLGRAELWVTDPELSVVYENVNLLAIDAAKPTCDEAQQLVYERVRSTFRRCDQNATGTARQLGLSKSFVDYVIAGPPQIVAA